MKCVFLESAMRDNFGGCTQDVVVTGIKLVKKKNSLSQNLVSWTPADIVDIYLDKCAPEMGQEIKVDMFTPNAFLLVFCSFLFFSIKEGRLEPKTMGLDPAPDIEVDQ